MIRGHSLRHYVFFAALGALAGYGVGMTIVKTVGWYPHPEQTEPEHSEPRTRWRSLLPPYPPPRAGAAYVGGE